MARPLRIEYPGAVYHMTGRGNGGQDIFLDDEDRSRSSFLKILAEVTKRCRLKIYGYVLMDNHYHLLLETLKANLVRAMHNIQTAYTQS